MERARPVGPADPGGDSQAPGSGPALPQDDAVSWRHVVAALRVRSFAWYWASQLLSGLGSWSQTVAQAWLVLELARTPSRAGVWLGTVTLLQFLPLLAFAPLGGVVADRLPRRRLLVATQSASAGQAVALGALVATGAVRLWEVGVLAFALGTTNALNNPAQQAFVPELVGRRLVADAVALNSVQFNSARMLGGALGGVAVAAWGVPGALFLNAASFLPAIAVLGVIRPAHSPPRRGRPAASMLAELRDGWRFACSSGPIRRVVLVFGAASLFGLNWQVVMPLVARFLVHRQVTGFGDLMAAFGAGSLLAALLLARDRRASERRLVEGALALGAALALVGLSRSYLASLLLVAGGGVASIVVTITANTRLQLLAPDHLRGRVMGIYVLLMGGTTPVGGFLLGEVAGRLGVRPGIVAFGVVTAASVAAAALATRRRAARDSRGEAPPPEGHRGGWPEGGSPAACAGAADLGPASRPPSLALGCPEGVARR
ncbi:MAG TPA: MFS transporter [Acidimicrobiales bacterium]|nr:MFS transporter [Acidimicrobiales bacterium]